MAGCDKLLGVIPILPKFGASFLNVEAVYRESIHLTRGFGHLDPGSYLVSTNPEFFYYLRCSSYVILCSFWD